MERQEKMGEMNGRKFLYMLATAIAFSIVLLSAIGIGTYIQGQSFEVSSNEIINIIIFFIGILFGGIALCSLVEIKVLEDITDEIETRRK